MENSREKDGVANQTQWKQGGHYGGNELCGRTDIKNMS